MRGGEGRGEGSGKVRGGRGGCEGKEEVRGREEENGSHYKLCSPMPQPSGSQLPLFLSLPSFQNKGKCRLFNKLPLVGDKTWEVLTLSTMTSAQH